jgi:hypothetical protein
MTTTSPSRDIAFPLGPIHFVRCAGLFASENSEFSQRKSPSERGCSGPCARRTTAALWRRFFGTHVGVTRCHSALLKPHLGGAFLRFGMQVGSHNSRSCSDPPGNPAVTAEICCARACATEGEAAAAPAERFNATAHMRVQWNRRGAYEAFNSAHLCAMSRLRFSRYGEDQSPVARAAHRGSRPRFQAREREASSARPYVNVSN